MRGGFGSIGLVAGVDSQVLLRSRVRTGIKLNRGTILEATQKLRRAGRKVMSAAMRGVLVAAHTPALPIISSCTSVQCPAAPSTVMNSCSRHGASNSYRISS
ncbi:hypothetical protein BJX68DRAFT_237145 [Aspergillus pseudodeflectus]|uniref:Uncharacterized protein n=1 Tax=Aspergillus pseudodeflectus TaxID=176178 RepID=A0ABR4KCH4_9EURO